MHAGRAIKLTIEVFYSVYKTLYDAFYRIKYKNKNNFVAEFGKLFLIHLYLRPCALALWVFSFLFLSFSFLFFSFFFFYFLFRFLRPLKVAPGARAPLAPPRYATVLHLRVSNICLPSSLGRSEDCQLPCRYCYIIMQQVSMLAFRNLTQILSRKMANFEQSYCKVKTDQRNLTLTEDFRHSRIQPALRSKNWKGQVQPVKFFQ